MNVGYVESEMSMGHSRGMVPCKIEFESGA